MLVPCLFLFSVLLWLQTNSQGETVKTLYFSYLAVLQKVANHVALLQTTSTSRQQVWVGFLNFFVMLFSIFGVKFLSQISLSYLCMKFKR